MVKVEKRASEIKSLEAINRLEAGDKSVLKTEKWLMYLYLTNQTNINFERVNALEDLDSHYHVLYVKRSLSVLQSQLQLLSEDEAFIVEKVLTWSEVAKGGLKHHRMVWLKKGYNLYVHNIGSAQIFDEMEADCPFKEIIHTLITTHGLVGQYIRGEVTLGMQSAVHKLAEKDVMTQESLERILKVLNHCIIEAVNVSLWQGIQEEVMQVVNQLVEGSYRSEYDIQTRLRKLRSKAIGNGEHFDKVYDKYVLKPDLEYELRLLLASADVWFVEAALHDFSFEEFVKIFLLIYESIDLDEVHHISFEVLMKDIYYDYEGRKKVNIYKRRIIENYLSELTIDNILDGEFKENPHVVHALHSFEVARDTVFFTFDFSSAAERLIEFCEEAEKNHVLYEKAVVMLFDLFGLRRDQYDRFHNEDKYLQTMNDSSDYKRVILDYIVGDKVVDIGPGGGALMNMIETEYPKMSILGVDISENVLEMLEKKKHKEKHRWEVVFGDALNLGEYLEADSVDTIIFCSIMHELYSYIEYDGKKFNRDTLAAALKSAYKVLRKGGRMIIRDGIMTEGANEKRIIKFLSEDGMDFLQMYDRDFKGRDINYQVIGHNEVMMPVNDAMEFLYTYTWGEDSYPHEINEQYGYFTPKEYLDFIHEHLGEGAHIITAQHYLQEGYTTALAPKVRFYNELGEKMPLPDSTCLIVVEKL